MSIFGNHDWPSARAQAQKSLRRWPLESLKVVGAVLSALAVFSTSLQAQGVSARSGDYVMAMVGSTPITHSDYVRAAAQMGATLSGEEVDKRVLEALINDKVVLQAAKKSGIVIGENELGAAVQNYLNSQNLNQAGLQKQLAQQGQTWEAFRRNLRDSLLVERFRNNELSALVPQETEQSRVQSAAPQLPPARARQPNKQSVEIARKLNLGHILILVPEGASPALIKQSEAKAQRAYARLRRGESFAKVAAAVSDAPEGKRNKGELGLVAVNDYPEFFVAAVQDLQKGQFTQPLRSPVGFHILKYIASQSERAVLSSGDTYVESLVRHILVPVKNKDELKAVREQIGQLAVRLKHRGEEFAGLAKEYSQDASAKNGGLIGWVEAGQLVPEFEVVMHALPLRTLSHPVVSPYGVHLLEVVERRVIDTKAPIASNVEAGTAAQTPTQAQAQAQANAQRQKQYEQAVSKWLENLRKDTYIEYRDAPL